MLLSIALIMLFGLVAGTIFKRMRLPYIIGMLAAGIILGPYVLNLLDDSILNISADLRQIALIVILAKAGLTLDINDLKRVGRPAVLLCFLPATMEIIAYLLFAPGLMGISLLEAGIIGAVMGRCHPRSLCRLCLNLSMKDGGQKKEFRR